MMGKVLLEFCFSAFAFASASFGGDDFIAAMMFVMCFFVVVIVFVDVVLIFMRLMRYFVMFMLDGIVWLVVDSNYSRVDFIGLKYAYRSLASKYKLLNKFMMFDCGWWIE